MPFRARIQNATYREIWWPCLQIIDGFCSRPPRPHRAPTLPSHWLVWQGNIVPPCLLVTARKVLEALCLNSSFDKCTMCRGAHGRPKWLQPLNKNMLHGTKKYKNCLQTTALGVLGLPDHRPVTAFAATATAARVELPTTCTAVSSPRHIAHPCGCPTNQHTNNTHTNKHTTTTTANKTHTHTLTHSQHTQVMRSAHRSIACRSQRTSHVRRDSNMESGASARFSGKGSRIPFASWKYTPHAACAAWHILLTVPTPCLLTSHSTH